MFGAVVSCSKGHSMTCAAKVATSRSDTGLPKEVAFTKEAKHKHVVDVYGDWGETHCIQGILMKQYDGSLNCILQEFRRNEAKILRCVEQLLRVVVFMTKNAVSHGDIKPTNMMYHCNANGSIDIKLGDFGEANRLITKCRTHGGKFYMLAEILGHPPEDGLLVP